MATTRYILCCWFGAESCVSANQSLVKGLFAWLPVDKKTNNKTKIGKNINIRYRPYYRILGLIISIVSIYIYYKSLGKKGLELLEDNIYTHGLTPFYGILVGLLALNSIQPNRNS